RGARAPGGDHGPRPDRGRRHHRRGGGHPPGPDQLPPARRRPSRPPAGARGRADRARPAVHAPDARPAVRSGTPAGLGQGPRPDADRAVRFGRLARRRVRVGGTRGPARLDLPGLARSASPSCPGRRSSMTTLAPRRRPAWYLIAVAEARMLARNQIALLTATVTPLALSGFVLAVAARSEADASAAVLAGTQLVMLLGFTVYATATMTLTSRREQLYLKRLRSSPAATTEIVGGLTAPLVGLLLAQVTVVLV